MITQILRSTSTYYDGGTIDKLPNPPSNAPAWEASNYRVDRVMSFFSSSWNWDCPTPSPAGECAPPPFGSGGRGTCTLLREGGMLGGPHFQRGERHCGTLGIYVLYASNPPTRRQI
jgi:hypothetical protein